MVHARQHFTEESHRDELHVNDNHGECPTIKEAVKSAVLPSRRSTPTKVVIIVLTNTEGSRMNQTRGLGA
jgi:hypothetical protein